MRIKKLDNKPKGPTAGALLKEGIQSITEPEQYRAFLKLAARFPKYSWRNLVLLMRQMPEALELHKYGGWRRYGRYVKKGEAGIKIRALFETEEPEKEKKKEEEENDFRTIFLYDISQTAEYEDWGGETIRVEIPPAVNQKGGAVEGYHNLMRLLEKVSPFEICFSDHGKGHGYFDEDRKQIVIASRLSEFHTIFIILQNIAFANMRWSMFTRQKKMAVSGSAACAACEHLNLDTSLSITMNEMSSWLEKLDDKERKKCLQLVRQQALWLTDSIDGAREAERIAYSEEDLTVLANPRTAQALFDNKCPVYLVYPGEGEAFALNRSDVEKHPGPFAVESETWWQAGRAAA